MEVMTKNEDKHVKEKMPYSAQWRRRIHLIVSVILLKVPYISNLLYVAIKTLFLLLAIYGAEHNVSCTLNCASPSSFILDGTMRNFNNCYRRICI